MSTSARLGVRTRRQTWLLLVAFAGGMLVAGLVLPFAVGSSPAKRTQLSSSFGSGSASFSAGETTTTTAVPTSSTVAAAQTATGSATASGAAPAAVVAAGRTAAVTGPTASAAAGTSASATAGTATQACSGATASARGVTPTSIKIGFFLLDVGNLGKFGAGVGGVTPATQQKAHQAFVDELNQQGGLCGRKIDPVYRSFDVTDQNQQLSQCAALTEDDKVFAVVSADGIASTTVSCIVNQHQTFLILGGDFGVGGAVMNQSGGRLFTLWAVGPRQMYNWIADLAARGRLNGKTVGVLTNDDPPDVSDGALLPAMQHFGVKVADVEKLPANDQGSAASQVPVAVQKMRSAGVDTVFITTGLVSGAAFAQTAENQAWHPTYEIGDWSSEGNDVFLQNMPSDIDAELVTGNDLTIFRNGPHNPQEDLCAQVYKNHTGQSIGKRPPDTNDSTYPNSQKLCTLDLFVLGPGLKAAGANLTYATLSASIEKLGTVATTTSGTGTYRAGKHDLQDQVMVGKADGSCKCWIPVTGWRPVAQK
jgi:hypothetical protein